MTRLWVNTSTSTNGNISTGVNGNTSTRKEINGMNHIYVYFTLPPFSNGFQRTFTGPSQFWQTQRTVRWTSNGIRRTWPNSAVSPVRVRSKSSEVTLKQKSIRLACPADFRWTSIGLLMVLSRKEEKYDKSLVRRTSTGLPTVLDC